MLVTYRQFQTNVEAIKKRIEAACLRSNRPLDSVKILPVTKTHPVDAVEYAHEFGFLAIGENRVQEVAGKQAQSTCPDAIEWELIGHLQSNKAKEAVQLFNRIQSVDSLKLANRLNRFSEELGKTLRVLIQVNAGKDPAKFGFLPEATPGAFEALMALKNLEIEGLMTIAPLDDDLDTARRSFVELRDLRDSLEQQFGIALPELSMGMTYDLEASVEAGSTQVRIGTALFGPRD